MAKINRLFYKDFLWYAVGMMVPMGINLIKTPIFTRHYSAEEYGYLGLIMMVFMYLSTVSYAWLSSCIWRYYNTFQRKGILPKFYANLIFLYGLSTAIMLICAAVFIAFYHTPFLVSKLIVICFLHFVTKELLGLYIVVLRVKGEAKNSNVLAIVQALASFGLLCFFAFRLDFDISALIMSSIVIDLILIIGLSIYLKVNKRLTWFSLQLVNRRYLKKFVQFGSFILLSSLVTLLIVSSDRYILAMYDSLKNVGVYTKVYDIAQISITAFVLVFFSVINPKMNRELSQNVSNSNPLLQQYLYAYLLILLPIVAILSMFSKEIADLLLGEEFRAGYQIMPYVFFSTFVYGLVTFSLNKLKFANRLKTILAILSLTFAVNLVLNLIFIPSYGYFGAAVTTFISYGLMLCLFFLIDDFGMNRQREQLMILALQLVVLLLFYALTHWIRSQAQLTVEYAIILGIAYLLVFVALFFRTYRNLKITV